MARGMKKRKSRSEAEKFRIVLRPFTKKFEKEPEPTHKRP
jgi:hypothetical protein